MFKPLESYLAKYDDQYLGPSHDVTLSGAARSVARGLLSLWMRIRQLRCEWAARPSLPETSFFWYVEREIGHRLDNLDSILTREEPELEDYDVVSSTQQALHRLSYAYVSVIGRLHDRLDSLDSPLAVDVSMRLGDRAGGADVIAPAAERLMAAYCGWLRYPQAGWATLRGSAVCWNGLVTMSTGRDFGILPAYGLLMLPPGLTLTRGSMICLAHQAAHFLFHHLRRHFRAFSLAYAEFDDGMRSCLSSTIEEDEQLQGWLEDLDESEGVGRRGLYVRRVSGPERYRRELFLDVIAILVGSPYYAVAAYDELFFPAPSASGSAGRPLVPPEVRIELGRVVCASLGVDPVWQVGIEQRISACMRSGETLARLVEKRRDSRGIIWESLNDPWNARARTGVRMFRRLNELVRSGLADGQWFLRVVDMLREFFEREFDPGLLFFEHGSGSEDSSAEVYHRCVKIAESLSEGRAVYGEDIKHVAVASKLIESVDELKWPESCAAEYPAGLVYESMVGATVVEAETVGQGDVFREWVSSLSNDLPCGES
jgi:hypothetical protein